MMSNLTIVTWVLNTLVQEGYISETVSNRTVSDFMKLQEENISS